MKKDDNGKVKLEHRVTSIEVCQQYLREDVANIKNQVNNEIPHKLSAMDDKFNKFTDSIQKQFIGILISIVLILLGIVLSFFKL